MKERNKPSSVIGCILFLGALAFFALGLLLLPKKTFSASERRYLADAPMLKNADFVHWDMDDAVEDYLADHLPLRDFFVGLDAYAALLSGRQVGREIWRTREGALVEAAAAFGQEAFMENLDRVAAFAADHALSAVVLAVPSAGYAERDALPAQLSALYADAEMFSILRARTDLHLVDLETAFSEAGAENYYKTDHHWNAAGVYAAYLRYMEQTGRTALGQSAFHMTDYAGFTGTTRSRAALWLTPADTLTATLPDADVTVTFSEAPDTVYQTLFFTEYLEGTDWYAAFLGNNHGLVTIENRASKSDGVLLILRDSFASSLAPLLVPHFRTVLLVDLRYYRQPVSELVSEYDVTELLLVYAISGLGTASAFAFLR